ncbi:MAG: AAA family ATPase [Solirubrobacteraceae bacterium]
MALRGLADRLGAIEMREVQRQKHAWDREALEALRQGRVHQWADAYREHDRIVTGTDAAQTRSRLVSDWFAATTKHPEQDNVMLAHRRADVAELNQRARATLRAGGKLGELELEANGRAFSTGDRVVTGRNDRANGITNGQRATVEAIDIERRSLTLTFDDGRQAELPAGYIDDGHLDHAYAMTAHRAQGATVDRAFVLGSDDLYREWGFTALSRHRDEARFYVNLGSAAQLTLPGLEMSFDRPDGPVTGPLSRERGKRLALDTPNDSGLRLQPPTVEEAIQASLRLDQQRLPDFHVNHVPDPDLDLDLGPDLDFGM